MTYNKHCPKSSYCNWKKKLLENTESKIFKDEVKNFGIWHRMRKINTQWVCPWTRQRDSMSLHHVYQLIISRVVSLLIDRVILSLKASFPLPWVTHNVAAIKANKPKTFSGIMVFLCPNLRCFFDSFGSTLISEMAAIYFRLHMRIQHEREWKLSVLVSNLYARGLRVPTILIQHWFYHR